MDVVPDFASSLTNRVILLEKQEVVKVSTQNIDKTIDKNAFLLYTFFS
jgi:hypothetical protein